MLSVGIVKRGKTFHPVIIEPQAAATEGPNMKTIKTKIYYTLSTGIVICWIE